METVENAPYLEVTVVSAQDLRIGRRRIKKNAFATVRTTTTTDSGGSFQSTSVNQDGGSYPKWNEKLQVRLPPRDRSILVEVHCKTWMGAKAIGAVSIPMSEIEDGYVPPDQMHCLSYRLRERDGEPNGIINLMIIMVGSKRHARPMSVVHPECLPNQPIPGAQREPLMDGVAIGIPVSTFSLPPYLVTDDLKIRM